MSKYTFREIDGKLACIMADGCNPNDMTDANWRQLVADANRGAGLREAEARMDAACGVEKDYGESLVRRLYPHVKLLEGQKRVINNLFNPETLDTVVAEELAKSCLPKPHAVEPEGWCKEVYPDGTPKSVLGNTDYEVNELACPKCGAEHLTVECPPVLKLESVPLPIDSVGFWHGVTAAPKPVESAPEQPKYATSFEAPHPSPDECPLAECATCGRTKPTETWRDRAPLL